MSLPSCPICMNYFETFEDVCAVACGHVLHFNCISRWVAECQIQRRSSSCPTCKRPVDLRRSSGTIHRIYFHNDGLGKSKEVRDLEKELKSEQLKRRLAISDAVFERSKVRKLSKDNDNLKKESRSWKDKLDKETRCLREVKTDLAMQKIANDAEISSLKTAITSHETTIAKLESDQEIFQNQIKDLKMGKFRQAMEIYSANSKSKKLADDRCREVEASLKAAYEVISGLKQERQTRVEKLKLAEEQIEELKLEKRGFVSSLAQSSERNEAARASLAALEKDYEAVRRKAEALEVLRENYSIALNATNRDYEAQLEMTATLTAQRDVAQSSLTETQTLLKSKGEECDQARSSLRESRVQMNVKSKAYERMKILFRRSQKDMFKAQAGWNRTKFKMEISDSNVKRVVSERDRACAERDGANEELERVRVDLGRAVDELERSTLTIADQKSQIEKMQREFEDREILHIMKYFDRALDVADKIERTETMPMVNVQAEHLANATEVPSQFSSAATGPKSSKDFLSFIPRKNGSVFNLAINVARLAPSRKKRAFEIPEKSVAWDDNNNPLETSFASTKVIEAYGNAGANVRLNRRNVFALCITLLRLLNLPPFVISYGLIEMIRKIRHVT